MSQNASTSGDMVTVICFPATSATKVTGGFLVCSMVLVCPTEGADVGRLRFMT